MKTFVSIVGTQVMAVLNPLLALIEKGETPDRVVLMVTDTSKDPGMRIKAYLAPKYLSDAQVEIIAISSSLKEDDKGNPPAQDITRELSVSDDLLFNLAGGMGFQNPACLLTMNPDNAAFLYPEENRVLAFRLAEGRIAEKRFLELPRAVDVMALQGISAVDMPEKMQRLRDDVKRNTKALLPNDVRSIKINDDYEFDCVRNTGNTLEFIKILPPSLTEEKLLEDVRKIIAIARDRSYFSDLMHKNITVLTRSSRAATRLREEAGGQISVRKYSANNLYPELVRSLFSASKPADHCEELAVESHPTGNKPTDSNTQLHLILGKDIMPSLIALWSHQPDRVCFLYTPGDADIARYKDALIAHKALLPAAHIEFSPIDFLGSRILDLPVPDAGRCEVNITPGNKLQKEMLALWAKRSGARVISLHNEARALSEIFSSVADRPLCGPEPATVLLLSGKKLATKGKDRGAIEKGKYLYDAQLQALRDMSSLGCEDIRAIFQKGGDVNGAYRFERNERDRKMAMTNLKTKERYAWSVVKEGDWFEQLMAHVLLQAGADDVRVGLATAWDADTEKQLDAKHGRIAHQSEIDVVARFGPIYYVVSCKSGIKAKVGKIANEAKAVDKLFGRFENILVAYLDHQGEPTETGVGRNVVTNIGPATFTDPSKMKAVLERIAKKGKLE